MIRSGSELYASQHAHISEIWGWEAFNDLLARQHGTWLTTERVDHRYETRLEVWLEGERVPHHQLVTTTRSMSNNYAPRFDDATLRQLVKQGATMVVRSAHEMDECIGELAHELERAAFSPTQATVVADCTGRGSTERHQQEHHCLVVQLVGHQRATVGDGRNGGQSVWSGTLDEGGILPIPAGCSLTTEGETSRASLHLELDVYDATPVDVFDFLLSSVTDADIVRGAVPRFGDPSHKVEWLSSIRRRLTTALDDDFLSRFRATRSAGVRAQRLSFSLPWSGTTDVLPKSGDAIVRWMSPCSTAPGGEIVVTGDSFTLTPEQQQRLAPLFSGEPTMVTDLHADGLGDAETREMIISWIILGHVAVLSVACHEETGP